MTRVAYFVLGMALLFGAIGQVFLLVEQVKGLVGP